MGINKEAGSFSPLWQDQKGYSFVEKTGDHSGTEHNGRVRHVSSLFREVSAKASEQEMVSEGVACAGGNGS